jgi:carboxyl-terminal processing protease
VTTLRAGTLLMAAVLSMAPAAAAQESAKSPVRQRTLYEDLQMFSQVLNQIRVNHPDSIPSQELILSAVTGMVQAADPHSYVLSALRVDPKLESALREGKVHPIPISFRFVDGAPIVVAVAPGTRAATQDILPGDELLLADGKLIAALSPEELDLVLAGPRGSNVPLRFERRRVDGTKVTIDRVVRRERPDEERGISAAFMLDATTGYVRITTFATMKVADAVHSSLRKLEGAGMQRLILDLRNNGGGLVSQASAVAGEFLPKGAIVYTASGRKEVTDTARVSRSFWRAEKRYPIVVLVNEGTASAAELVAGALQDHDRALIVGRPSFGKALLMRGFPLTDGSLVMLVVGQVQTPCGRVVQRSYRDVTRRDYMRLARAERDTTGRPSCRTSGGRVVYGGGGIYPDVLLPEEPGAPLWLARAREGELLLKWVGGYVAENRGSFTTAEALSADPRLPPSAIAAFRSFAAGEGIQVPDDPAATERLERWLLAGISYTLWGAEGQHLVTAVLDPQVGAARSAFDRAAAVLAAQR